MRRSKALATDTLFRFLCLILSVSIFASLCAPMLQDAAAQVAKWRRSEQLIPVKIGDKLGKNLPDLTRVRDQKATQPSAPTFNNTARPCFDCKEPDVPNDALSAARLELHNRTGQPAVDLLSQNFNWRKTLIDLNGRAKLNLELALVYNSLVWTKANSQIAFDADRGQPSPGFRLGFPTIQQRYLNAQTRKYAYLLIRPDGGRVELRQSGNANTYEATDASLLKMIDQGASGALLRRPDGTQLNFQWIGGQLQCTEVKDRNGNYITANYNKRGHLSNITDTLGRTLVFDRDKSGNLLSITQKDDGSNKRVLATFGYSDLTMQTNFVGLQAIGPANGSTITVLTQLGLPDGTRYQFDYTSWGQIERTTLYAADGHALAYTSYNLPQNASTALTDVPGSTELRNWAEGSNDDAEAVTRFDFDGSGASGRAILPDGSSRREFFGTAGWDRGLPVRIEERDASGALQKSTTTEWAQQDDDKSYRVTPSSQEVVSVDAKGNRQRARTEYTSFGLPKDVYDYAGDGTNFLRRTHIEYNLDAVNVNRHIIGLMSEQVTYGPDDTVISKTTHAYDLAGSLVDQGVAVQHDNLNYGSGFLTGRGLLSAIRQWEAKDPNNEAKAIETRLGYNTTGSVAFTRDSSGRQTNVSYSDNFADGKNRNTLAFATTAIHPDGKRTSTQYDYTTSDVLWTQNSRGVVQSFAYDAAGRMTARLNHQTGASARRVYDESSTLVATFTKVKATTKEFGSYKVYDGVGRVRARALDPLSSAQGLRGINVKRDAIGRIVNRTKLVRMTSTWEAVEVGVSYNPVGQSEQETGIALAITGVKQFGEKLFAGLDSLVNAVEPTAQAQDCYNDYYGDTCAGDPYNNDWFYGDQWGSDWYWDWTDFADALIWGDSQYWYSSDWDTLSYLAGLSDREIDTQIQFANSGYFGYATNVQWNGHGYSGTLPLWTVSSLYNDPNFADGPLYGFHTDVGRDIVDFRSFTGTFGDGSLQIVVDETTGRFHTDVDRFNPYQDVVNFFGHTFGEVVPNLFRRIF